MMSLTLFLNYDILPVERIVHCRGTVYVGSNSYVWLLDSRPQMKSNLERLVNEKQFELAVQLAVIYFLTFFLTFSVL